MPQTTQYNELLAQLDTQRLPHHVGIVMDGNGRWATARHLPRSMGHRAGVEALKRAVEVCHDVGVPYLTVYAFSTENWQRPAEEVGFLMRLFIEYFHSEVAVMNRQDIRLDFIGDPDGLPPAVHEALDHARSETAANKTMTLTIAINDGGRDELTRAVRGLSRRVQAGSLQPDDIDAELIGRSLDTADMPDVDLLIRPSGELRLSNFLLWQSAYAEFYFTDILWPDFSHEDMLAALIDYQGRSRRFGKTEAQAASKVSR